MEKELLIAIDLIDRLNSENGWYRDWFQVRVVGYDFWITFLGVSIWCYGEDERKFIEEINEYEDLEGYIRKVAKERVDLISKIKL